MIQDREGVMQSLANEVYTTIQSSRIANVRDSVEDIVSVLQEDQLLFEEVEKRLNKKDILWFNRNNNSLFFEIPNDNNYQSSSRKMTLDEELKWFNSAIDDDSINWENVRYRYKRALKFLGTKDVIYYDNIRKIITHNHEDKWRFLNE